MAASPTQRTLDHFRALGSCIGVVEKWNQYAGEFGQRVDLFGFADLFAFDDTEEIMIQATSTGNMRSRQKKILENDNAKAWLRKPGRRIVVIGWKKYAKPVDRKWWRPSFIEITAEMFNDATTRGVKRDRSKASVS